MTTSTPIPAERSDEEALRHAASLIPAGMTFRNKDELFRYVTLLTRQREGGRVLDMRERHQLWDVSCTLWTQGQAVAL